MKLISALFALCLVMGTASAQAGWFNKGRATPVPAATPTPTPAPKPVPEYVPVESEKVEAINQALVDAITKIRVNCVDYAKGRPVSIPNLSGSTFLNDTHVGSSYAYKLYRRTDGQPVLELISGEGGAQHLIWYVTTDSTGTRVAKLEFVDEASHQENGGTIVNPEFVTVWAQVDHEICTPVR